MVVEIIARVGLRSLETQIFLQPFIAIRFIVMRFYLYIIQQIYI